MTALCLRQLIASGLLLSCLAPAVAGEPGDDSNGKHLYLSVGCFECHGRAGEGGFYNYPVPALAKIRFPLETFKAIVRLGPNDMPSYSAAVLSDADLADIYAFISTLPGPGSAKGTALLNF